MTKELIGLEWNGSDRSGGYLLLFLLDLFPCVVEKNISRFSCSCLMSKHPYSTHHSYAGRPCIVVRDNDVLSGRGVNIAQHPGNERFRAMVSTRYDESYCSTYSTSEKRALAEEIIKHIKSLDPPGRFLKRSGRSQSTRGLSGPWEELSPQECIKKTCQALRDCNRNDRQGYAAQVSVPVDVRENAEKRSASGLSLREHAAAAVAKAEPAVLCTHHVNMNPPPVPSKDTVIAAKPAAKKRPSIEIAPDSNQKPSPSLEAASGGQKKQRMDQSPEGEDLSSGPFFSSFHDHAPTMPLPPLSSTSSAPSLAPTSASSTHSTPATNYPYQMAYHLNHANLSSIIVPQLTPPAAYSAPAYYHHHDPHAMVPVPFVDHHGSPVGIYSPPPHEVSNSHAGYGVHTPPQISVPSPQVHGTPSGEQEHLQDHDHQIQDLPHPDQLDAVQTAADVAAALASSPPHGMGFSLLNAEDVHQGALSIDDL